VAGAWERWRDELARIRYRLLLINLLIVSVPLLGIGFARFYEREMLRSLEDDMIHQAMLLRAVVLADPAGPSLAMRTSLLVSIARETRMRMRLLDAAGTVLADSHVDGPPEGTGEGETLARLGVAANPPPEPHRANLVYLPARPEIVKALAGGYGATTRIWRFDGGTRVYLFVALPIRAPDGVVRGIVYVTRSTMPVVAAMHRLRVTLWRVLLGAFAATAVLTLFLAATISRPLGRLTDVAQRIAGGARVEPMRLERRDEIGRLARAVDTMAQKLDGRAQDVADLAANLSHEFKSPLTSIRGAAELLVEGAADDPDARRLFLENIRGDADRLDRLVTRLLELSRLEADTTPMETIALDEVVADAVAARRGPAPIDVAYAATAVHVRGRRTLLASMVGNLLDNAEQHARPGSRVTLRVEDRDAGHVRLAVHNVGDPISPANLARVWDRFFTTRGDAGGSGLGLPIVASVARAHGGRVGVESSPGAGTTFTVELPVAKT
jgi:two-component system sensor histidine kinase ChvG